MVAKEEFLDASTCPITPQEIKMMKRVPYKCAISSLIYDMQCTSPDINFAMGLASQYQSNPGKRHWMIVKRIFRYTNRTSKYSLCYQE